MHIYDKLTNNEFKDLNSSYDYKSIMHYSEINPHAVDKSKPIMKGIKGKIDPSKELSEIDIYEIRKLYNCKSSSM